MEHLSSGYSQPEPSAVVGELAPLLDVRHLDRQTLSDPELRAVVLGLFLDEAPRLARDIAGASDVKAWRMAVHTLKGVALNIGAFRLASLCKQHEMLGFDHAERAELAAAIAESLREIRNLLG